MVPEPGPVSVKWFSWDAIFEPFSGAGDKRALDPLGSIGQFNYGGAKSWLVVHGGEMLSPKRVGVRIPAHPAGASQPMMFTIWNLFLHSVQY